MVTVMEFKGYKFPYNPRKFTQSYNRHLVRIPIPGAQPRFQQLGAATLEVKGEGEFFGTDAVAQFERLEDIFAQGGSGMLLLPGGKTVEACFLTLEMVGEAGPGSGAVRYRFQFTECPAGHLEVVFK